MSEVLAHTPTSFRRLFSRVEPAHKSLIVEYLQEDGNVCAMVSTAGRGGWWVGQDSGEWLHNSLRQGGPHGTSATSLTVLPPEEHTQEPMLN